MRRAAKPRLYPHTALPPEAVEHWNTVLMPQINQALRQFHRKNPESVEISLESIGQSSKDTTPTVLVVCTSVSKVKAILKKKMSALYDGTAGYALKVCRGHMVRSRNDGASIQRSMACSKSVEEGEVAAAANGGFQERPLNGASIGAWIGDRHLPPVSFGGLVVIDNKTYGMTVHHMLDAPDQQSDAPAEATGGHTIQRSGAGSGPQVPDLAAWYAQQYRDVSPSSGNSSDSEEYAAEFSDTDSDLATGSDITSQYEYSDEEYEEDQFTEPGDIPGIEPGCGDGYIISQPALDDVDEEFYAGPDTQDEEHLDSFGLGEVFASSGIRRRNDERGLVHEIDWALFEFKDERQPEKNSIPRVNSEANTTISIHPKSVAPAYSLPNLEVQCMARTSGLQTGVILPALTSVKMYGRTSPSHTYQVTSLPAEKGKEKPRTALGLPGDSGAWIVDRANGKVCGHVLAFSQRKKVAYICPMDVMLLDICETLEASEVKLPGGKPVISMIGDDEDAMSQDEDETFDESLGGDGSDMDPELRSMAVAKRRSTLKGKSSVRIRTHEVGNLAGDMRRVSLNTYGRQSTSWGN